MDFLHMLNFILRNNFQLDFFSKVMPFVYFNKRLIKVKDTYFTIPIFSRNGYISQHWGFPKTRDSSRSF